MGTTDQITVLIFKDNHTARSFRVSIPWIIQIGLISGGLILLLIVSLSLFVKYYRLTAYANPGRVHDLEQELVELRATYEKGSVENKCLSDKKAPVEPSPPGSSSKTVNPLAAAVPSPVIAGASPLASLATSTTGSNVTPIDDKEISSSPEPGELAERIDNPLAPPYFAAVPSHVVALPKEKVPISIDAPRIFWKGRTLFVSFNIQFLTQGSGSQQGRIILLARGPETVLAYPDGVLNRAGSESLIAPEQGEYFSVSRFREVKAQFGPLNSQDSLTDLEIFLISQDGHALIYRSLAIPAHGSSS